MSDFTCEECGRTFAKGRSDAEAELEAQELWGVSAAACDPTMAVVCDDCFNAIIKRFGSTPAPETGDQ